MPCVSVVVSGDFCCFKLALPSLLFLSKDEFKAAHSDFDRCPRGGDLRTENPLDRHFSPAIFYDLRSLHPGTCLNTKTSRAFRWKQAFYTWISKFASFWPFFEQANWTRPRKKLGYEVNFHSTASGTVDQCTILTPSPQRQLGRLFGAQTNSAWTTVEIGVYSLEFVFWQE